MTDLHKYGYAAVLAPLFHDLLPSGTIAELSRKSRVWKTKQTKSEIQSTGAQTGFRPEEVNLQTEVEQCWMRGCRFVDEMRNFDLRSKRFNIFK